MVTGQPVTRSSRHQWRRGGGGNPPKFQPVGKSSSGGKMSSKDTFRLEIPNFWGM